MKLLNIYESTITGDNFRSKSKTLIHQVIVETKDQLADIVSLLNSQAKINEQHCDERGDYTAYIIELKDVTSAHIFINEFVNILDTKNLIDYANRINNIFDNKFVMIGEYKDEDLDNIEDNNEPYNAQNDEAAD